MSAKISSDFELKCKQARLRLLKMHHDSKVGHIGGNLSCIDALMLLFHQFKKKPDDIILSKGHSAGALYVTLWSMGLLKDDDLLKFHKDHSKLAGHPAPGWLGEIPFATGSLGHGLSLAAGMALGKRLRQSTGQLFCVTSDGEWQEGATWEALIFIAHHQLTNLTVLVDQNGLQGFGTTTEVASMSDLSRKISSFSVDIKEVDGHNLKQLCTALETKRERPLFVIMHTRKGKGVSFMENKMEWHYLPMSEEQYRQAVKEVEAT
jgi:transketolase